VASPSPHPPARPSARPSARPALVCLWLALLLTLALALPSPAAAKAGPGILTVALEPGAARRVVAGQVQLLVDAEARLSSAAVLAVSTGWRPGAPDAIRLPVSNAAFWLRVRVANSGQQPGRFVLNLGSARQDHVRWVVADPAGRIVLERDTGDRLPWHSRLTDTAALALPLVLAPGDWRDVYVRLKSHDGLSEPLPAELSGEAQFHAHASEQLAFVALYAGAVLALVLYNLFLGLSTRAPAFAAYVLYGVGLLVWSVTYNGIGFAYLWPDQPVLNHQLPLIASIVAYAGAWWFIPTYLRLHERPDRRGAQRAYRWSAWANLLCTVPVLGDHYTLAIRASCLAALPMVFYTPWLSFQLHREGHREAAFLGWAFTAPVVALTVFYSQLFGLAPYSEWGMFSIQIGSFIEMGLLAFGLADSMNALKAQKLAAERRALEAQRALAQSLEIQVAERTQALEHANRRLGQLAVTDELTGAFNRRRFNDTSAVLVGRKPPRAPLALGMFDLDHFKRYNDQYGHQAGDAVLRHVVRAVDQTLGGQGELFRLGGEEFGVLFSASSAAEAQGLASRLRSAVEAMRLTHAGNEAGVVTASFGVLWCGWTGPRLPNADELYAAADLALYEAKHTGRNRVVVHDMARHQGLPSGPGAGTNGDCVSPASAMRLPQT
jgi:diguanylate cyclase (GGDEF)-like protein